MVLEDAVAGTWPALAARLDETHALGRWAAREPALADLARAVAHGSVDPECEGDAGPGPGPVIDLGGVGSPWRADPVVGALVRLAARDGGDDPDAVLLLVHLLAPGVLAAAARVRDLTSDPVALVVGALAVRIRVFPWRRRTRAYAANLLRDTWRDVAHELGIATGARAQDRYRSVELLVDLTPGAVFGPTTLREATGPGGVVPGPSEDPGPVPELADLTTWLVRRGVTTAGDLGLVLDLERHRDLGYGHGGLPAVAARHRVSERTVRRRRDRALAAARAAVPDYLRAVA